MWHWDLQVIKRARSLTDFAEHNSRVQDALWHWDIQRRKSECALFKEGKGHFQRTPLLAFYIVLKHRDLVTHPRVASHMPYAKVSFFCQNSDQVPHAQLLHSIPEVISYWRSLLCWLDSSHRILRTDIKGLSCIPNKGRICHLCSEENCKAHTRASTAR